ncbi:leucine-rich glioma-inactivated protein 1-like [Trichogramma pretiosum]|uniref:Uncharacterized protein n=1 Tax=Trichogramma kaykai TaxID=54128 RepID=A0ABD2VV36_9HYME|nr:leucine-rich glioma-inactivated protein 1-like [Trichogramma pretiosum]
MKSSLAKCCLCLLAMAAMAEAFCYRKNPLKSQDMDVEQMNQPGNYSIWVCVKSIDLATDLEKAPKGNISQIWFSMSTVEKIKNEAFLKFYDKLVKLEIWSSKLAEIEDGAFKGLRELKGLVLPRNEITVLKASWFRDLSKLLELNLANNRIASIEIDFLKSVPALINLDLRGNDLVALPTDFVKHLPATLRQLNIFSNPLNYHQQLQVVEWSKNKDDKLTNEPKMKELKHVLELTKNCLDDKNITDKTNEAIDKCVDDKLNEEVATAVKS